MRIRRDILTDEQNSEKCWKLLHGKFWSAAMSCNEAQMEQKCGKNYCVMIQHYNLPILLNMLSSSDYSRLLISWTMMVCPKLDKWINLSPINVIISFHIICIAQDIYHVYDCWMHTSSNVRLKHASICQYVHLLYPFALYNTCHQLNANRIDCPLSLSLYLSSSLSIVHSLHLATAASIRANVPPSNDAQYSYECVISIAIFMQK